MRKIWDRLRDPATWAGLAVAATSYNWAAVMPMGSQTWWFSVFGVVGGIAAAVIKNSGGGGSN